MFVIHENQGTTVIKSTELELNELTLNTINLPNFLISYASPSILKIIKALLYNVTFQFCIQPLLMELGGSILKFRQKGLKTAFHQLFKR